MANTVDIVLLRKRQKRRRLVLRLIIFLAILILCAFVYSQRDKWFSQLERISTRYQNVTQSEDAAGDGEFALSVSGGVSYQAEFIGNHLFILCDKYLYVYNTDGKLQDSRQHAYSNAVMKTTEKRSLVYSCGGTAFRVDAPDKMLYEKTLEQPIWFAVLSEEGYAAVVTESETYACRMTVFDESGKMIYSRECVERLCDVSFYGNGCIFSTISAEEGELMTTLQYITFDSNEVQWETTPLPTLCLKLYALPDGGAFVIGDTRAAYYSSTGALVGSYDFTAKLVDYAYCRGRSAVLLKNEERRQSILLLFSDKSSAPAILTFDDIAESVIVDDHSAYLLDSGKIIQFSLEGDELGTTVVRDAYERIRKYGKYFYLLGYDRIHRTVIQ